jgi:cleavage and polyadenylation specificity factor subunit 1
MFSINDALRHAERRRVFNVDRLYEFKDTFKLAIFTLDLVTHRYPVISPVQGLPHDCIYMVACPANVGGVVVFSSNALIYIER